MLILLVVKNNPYAAVSQKIQQSLSLSVTKNSTVFEPLPKKGNSGNIFFGNYG
jgi:hypothetical protein